MSPLDQLSRRRALSALAAAVGGALTTGTAAAQETTTAPEPLETFELGGRRSGWEGVAPESIAGEVNPDLQFPEVGGRYRVVWENLDGEGHNFVIKDDHAQNVVETPLSSVEGNRLSVEFEATETMTTYLCEPHAAAMRGDVIVGDVQTTTAEPTAGPTTAAPTTDARQAAIDELVAQCDYVLDGLTAGWEGIAPDGIAGETNPTLDLTAGETTRIGWINGDGAQHNIAVRDDEGVVQRTEFVTGTDVTQTLEFEASGGLLDYVCQVHPSTMLGDLSVGASGTATTDAADGGSGGPLPGFGPAAAVGGAAAAAAARLLSGRRDDE